MSKNKILLVNHGPNHTGWGTVTKSMVEALSGEFDLVCRTVNLRQNDHPKWYKKLEEKSLDGVTAALQYIHPNYYTRYPDVTNIGITEIEYSNMQYCEWLEYYDVMDQIWVSNKSAKAELGRWVSPPIHIVDHPYKKPDINVHPLQIPEIDGNYIFILLRKILRGKILR
jgi:hypothetical protein